MKAVNPDTPKKKDPRAVLLIGPPGGGKSSLLLQLPNIGVLDVDTNLDGPTQFLQRRLPSGVKYMYDQPTVMPTGRPAKPEEVWPNILSIIQAMVANKDIKWIGVDGLTGTNFHLINYVMHRAGKKEMSQDLWIPFRQELLKFINTVRLAGKDYAMTCHEEIDSNREGQITRRSVSVDSKLKHYFGGWFTDVWRCVLEAAPGNKVRGRVTTRLSTVDDLKASNPDTPSDVLLDFNGKDFSTHNSLLKYLL